MTEVQPVGTATMAGQPTAADTANKAAADATRKANEAAGKHPESADEQKRLNQQVYDFRKTADPLLYERVIAFHPNANQTDDAFNVMKADYERVAAEHLPPTEPPADQNATQQPAKVVGTTG
jgi:hypothetical protein